MAKKREETPDEGSPAWMNTFSDLMNLLLCFFVLLFASSTMDEGKIQQIAASFQNISFSIFTQTSQTIQNGQMVSGGVTQLEGIQSIMEKQPTEQTGMILGQMIVPKPIRTVQKPDRIATAEPLIQMKI